MDICGRFVVQEHTRAGRVHWDWMFESADVLETWRLEAAPADLAGHTAAAVRIFDHDLKFLAYEGSVNEGAGMVKIADSGTYRLTAKGEQGCEIALEGNIIKGELTLRHIGGDKWKFLFS